MSVTLESRTRRLQVFHLSHEICCSHQCTCTEVTVVAMVENPRTGERAPQSIRKKVPGSLTLLARGRTPALPTAILELPEVKTAIARGDVRILEHTAEPAPPLPANANPAIAPVATGAASGAAQGQPARADAAPKEP